MTTPLPGNARGATAAISTAVQWLDTPTDPAALGGKAQPLARLLEAGLPVPPGFVIAPHAFAALPEQSGENTSMPLPDSVQEQIRAAYAELGRRLNDPSPLVAVRSSANVEDLAGASFAGQYETYLGVRGAEAVIECAVRCWASLWSAHAVSYRQQVETRSQEPLPPPAMAVLIQALIPAEAAGVAFSADPLTGDPSTVTINAAWGLGQSVVDGEVEADTWRIDRHTRAIAHQSTGDKASRSGLGLDASRVPVPGALRRQPCLTAEQALQVADLTLGAEAQIGTPADVEWAIENDTLWLLQARPITTGGSATQGGALSATPDSTTPAEVAPALPVGPSPEFPFAWPDQEAPTLHWRLKSLDQRRAEVLRPLECQIRRHFFRSRQHAAGIRGAEQQERILHVNGYEYFTEVPVPFSEDERLRRKESFERPAIAIHDRGDTYLHAVVFPEVDAGNARLVAVDLPTADPQTLATHLQDAFNWYERSWTLHWMWGPKGPKERFSTFYKEITGDDRPEAADELLIYEPNLLTAAIDGLVDLARIAQQHPPLHHLISQQTTPEVLASLDATPGGGAFRTRLDTLLEEQGLRCGAGFGTEQNQCLPGWREDPSIVIDLVRRYLPQDLNALYAAREEAVRQRDARVEEIRRTISDPQQREQFDFWLAAARRAQQGFEDHNYKIDSAASALLHRAITGCAQRLIAAGILTTPDDIWWLERHEITLALQTIHGEAPPESRRPVPGDSTDDQPPLPLGEAARSASEGSRGSNHEPPSHWPHLIAARQALHRWHESLTPPPTLGAPPPPKKEAAPPTPASSAGQGAAPKPEPPPNALVKGQTGSTGIATGRVRLTDHHALVPDVSPGDILVAHNAGPLWTPVFPTVAAVILDEGALFQHAMLTCREYGVPAIFQTKDATKRLTEGQHVTVDASNGWVLPAPPQGSHPQ